MDDKLSFKDVNKLFGQTLKREYRKYTVSSYSVSYLVGDKIESQIWVQIGRQINMENSGQILQQIMALD